MASDLNSPDINQSWAALVTFAATCPTPATAAFPGQNGVVLHSGFNGIVAFDPATGTDSTFYSDSSIAEFAGIAASKDGSKVVYSAQPFGSVDSSFAVYVLANGVASDGLVRGIRDIDSKEVVNDDPSGPDDLVLLNVDGTGTPTVIDQDSDSDSNPSFRRSTTNLRSRATSAPDFQRTAATLARVGFGC